MSDFISADAAKLAGLQMDLLAKLRNGQITLAQLEWFCYLGKNQREQLVNGQLAPIQPSLVAESPIAASQISWQEATAKAYELLGMAKEHTEFCKEFSVPEVSGKWTLAIIEASQKVQKEGKEEEEFLLTSEKIIKVFREALGVKVYCYWEDLDASVPKNDRDPKNGSYVITVDAVVEADENHKNKSANMLAKEDHQGITLTERLFLELVYFLATRKHLDEDNCTLWPGARHSVDDVPRVGFRRDYDEVSVYGYLPGVHGGGLRSRSVSVLPAKKRASVA